MTLANIDHLVVVCFENRSFDNLLGYVYEPGSLPPHNLPPQNPTTFDGLAFGGPYSNTDPAVNGGKAVAASKGAASTVVPDPDPGEPFPEVTKQIFNGGNVANMSGFLTNYAKFAKPQNAAQIMQSYSRQQVSVISTIARSFAVCDAWYSSVPTQTWPNRGFIHTGSSDGHIVNGAYIPYANETIFNVLDRNNVSWNVFADTFYTPALTRIQFTRLWGILGGHFDTFTEFLNRCNAPANAPASQKLPTYSFIEPRFVAERRAIIHVAHSEDYHPPHDVRHAEDFLRTLYNAVAACPYRDRILLVITFDEHGGCYDHVPPPDGAQPPQPHPVSNDGTFNFDRFGVRVPTIVVSSYVKPGTVFRSAIATPYDHTSILATIREWQSLHNFLPSPRIAAAPTLEGVLTETVPMPNWPPIGTTAAVAAALDAVPETVADADLDAPVSDLEMSIVVGTERMMRAQEAGLTTATAAVAAAAPEVHAEIKVQVKTTRDAMEYLRKRVVGETS